MTRNLFFIFWRIFQQNIPLRAGSAAESIIHHQVYHSYDEQGQENSGKLDKEMLRSQWFTEMHILTHKKL